MPRPRWGVAVVVSLLVWSAVFFAGSRVASADPGPEFVVPDALATEPALPAYAGCPGPLDPEPLASEDPAAVQVYELRRDAGDACRAQADRLDQVVVRQWWIVSQLLGQQERLKLADERLERIEPFISEIREGVAFLHSDLEGTLDVALPGIDAENPLPVEGAAGASLDTSEIVTSIDRGAEVTEAALYFLAGLAVAMFIGYCLWRTVLNGS